MSYTYLYGHLKDFKDYCFFIIWLVEEKYWFWNKVSELKNDFDYSFPVKLNYSFGLFYFPQNTKSNPFAGLCEDKNKNTHTRWFWEKQYSHLWKKLCVMSHFLRLVKPTLPLVILLKMEKSPNLLYWIRRCQQVSVIGIKTPNPRHSALSNREPFKSSNNEQDRGRERRERGKGRHKKRERAMERCKMERITNEGAAEREP